MIALRAASPGFGVEPAAAYHDAITLLHDLREWANIWLTVESLATWWASVGRLEPAARVLGYLRAAGRGYLELEERRARAVAAIEAHPEHEAWLGLGAATDREQLIGYVLDELEVDMPRRSIAP